MVDRSCPRCRLYASAMAANDTTPQTNPTNSMAPKSHSATKTTGTSSSKNLPYASPMVPANARARGRWGVPEGWVRRGLQLVLIWAVDFRRRRGAVLNMATITAELHITCSDKKGTLPASADPRASCVVAEPCAIMGA
jgi:hypothetical protein